jgi:hypothetical protein
MVGLSEIFPQLPYEILNTILSFSEDGVIRARYSRGRMVYRIHWDSDSVCDLEALLLVRRIWPMYWYYDADSDERYIYFFMKDYFKAVIKERGVWDF